MSLPATPRMAKCLDLIESLTVNNVPPSLDDLREGLGLSSRGPVHHLLSRMKDRGMVEWEPGRARTLRITRPDVDLGAMTTAQLMTLSDRIDKVLEGRGY